MKTSAALRYLAGRAVSEAELAQLGTPCGQNRRMRRSGKKAARPQHPAWTLRDLRRAMSRGANEFASRLMAQLADLYGIRSLSDLDRLISRFGPDTGLYDLVAKRPEATRTNHVIDNDDWIEVDEGKDANATVHGGDGNSGECDHLADTSADDRQPVSETACAAGGAGDTPDGTFAMPGPAGLQKEAAGADQADACCSNAAGDEPACQGENGADEATGEMGTQPSAAVDASDNGPEAHGASSAQAGGDEPADGTCDEGAVHGGDADSPAVNPSAGHGSADHLDRDEAERLVREARQQHAARRLVAALRRLVESTCAPRGASSHRIDGKALVRELVSRRYAVHRARRAEREIRDIVIAIDASGSCARTTASTYAAAMQAAALLPRERVTVVTHTNGLCIAGVRGYTPAWLARVLTDQAVGLGSHYYSNRQREASSAVWDAIIARRPGLVLMLGDMDSHHVHVRMHEAGIRVMLMTWIDGKYDFSNIEYDVVRGVVDTITAADGLDELIRKEGL